jgi:hypothetical protein
MELGIVLPSALDVVDMKRAIGPDGRWLTLADLPSPNTTRWVIRRKAEVLAAVRGDLLSLEDACSHYALSREEVLSWQQGIARALGSRGFARPDHSYIARTREVGDSGPYPRKLNRDRAGNTGLRRSRQRRHHRHEQRLSVVKVF